MQYVYLPLPRKEGCATVGFYDPKGKFIAESDHPTNEEAAHRVAKLNGGAPAETPVEKFKKNAERGKAAFRFYANLAAKNKSSPTLESLLGNCFRIASGARKKNPAWASSSTTLESLLTDLRHYSGSAEIDFENADANSQANYQFQIASSQPPREAGPHAVRTSRPLNG